MADQQHLDMLKQGIDAWNAWRSQHPAIEPDFSDADLHEIRLIGLESSGANLRRANLCRADLRGASLRGASLRGAKLSGANLRKADLRRADLIEADLRRADLTEADLRQANLSGAELFKAKLTQANLTAAYMSGARLSQADLSQTNLTEADLTEADLTEADLRRADFTQAAVVRVDLTRADLTEAHLIQASLIGANLSQAYLTDANFSRADLSRANLNGANLQGTILTETSVGLTQFVNVDLRAVTGLETMVHEAPSSIGIDTLLRSKAIIPESFLRKTGVPEDFLLSIHSLSAHPIEYFTCFIAYASEDQEFAENLSATLQDKGVQCWSAWDDWMIRQRIDEAVRVYDKLLLILSRYSVSSPAEWLEYVVETALARESRERRMVLFPIRLDSAVIESSAPWATRIQATRQMEDFTHWKDHDAYQQALVHLLRDLQPDGQPFNETP